MNLPGFKAEASLYKTNKVYWANRIAFGAEAAFGPASRGFPCATCHVICAGGSIICERWCACACRGGTHCGRPD
jgi:hypothetical protein